MSIGFHRMTLPAAAWWLVGCAGADGETTRNEPDGGSSSPVIEAGTDTGAAEASVPSDECDVEADGVEVLAVDLDGYPPYAVDGCRLLYVSSADTVHGGALISRNLLDGSETVLSPPEALPRRPTLSGEVSAWEEMLDGARHVRVRFGDHSMIVTGEFHHSGEPRATSDAVVLTGFLTADEEGDSDVFLFTVEDRTVALVAGGPGQQRFADVSETHVAITDFSEDAGGAYDPEGEADADLQIFERGSGEITVRRLAGKQAYPMLGARGSLAYLEWTGPRRPVPKLAGYAIRAVPLAALDTDAVFVASVNNYSPGIVPAAFGDVIEWVETNADTSILWRARLDRTIERSVAPGLSAVDLYAPVSTERFTVLASRRIGQAATLRAVPRALDEPGRNGP
jgi:hypothetical protein